MSKLFIIFVFVSMFLGCASQEVRNENLPEQEVMAENNEQAAQEQVVALKITGMT
ncbi:hypothetical protein [Candidatus Uabimicrobium amorphum]|uniref:Uncharacterized protein n=1 Tax=Uabimicrobium amorphum TaxID=2596890 RepID=A0A5S9F666_UABAM|nr:hypothetical protein [Candidatus Uabimicrobium amorphum]BBM87577.1 hypothetical protein UABAM_05989 [Candidatus Uabimicrobium amorphum]